MRSAARAIGWEFSQRHRWGLIALGAYVAAFWASKLLILGPQHPIELNPPNGLAAFIIAPVSMTYFYFVGAFSYGLSGDLAARQSIYPARMLTLPVTTRALAGWPMLFGTAAAASLWWATAFFILWPDGVDAGVPFAWPALLMAAYLAWTQALMWMPYGLPGLRVIVAVLWLAVVDTIVVLAVNYQARESVMVAILAPQIPLAYLVAWFAVARARRGDVPDWSGLFVRLRRIGNAIPRPRDRVLSPARAQTWVEWRQHGRLLPALVAIVVPCELLLLFIPGNDTAPIVFVTLIIALVTPPFLAIFAAASVSAWTPFMATRPVTSAALVAAKLKATFWSACAAWLLVLAAVPLALWLSGAWPVFVERVGAGIEVTGTARAIAMVLLVQAALLASTWKALVQGLCIALTGREWVIKSAVLLALSFLVAVGPLAEWIFRSRSVQSVIWNGLPWILVALVCVKMAAAAWIAVRLYDSRLLSDRVLIGGAVCWLITVVALYGVLEWLAASPLVPRYFLGAVAVLQVPLARVSAAPLALAWNRHR